MVQSQVPIGPKRLPQFNPLGILQLQARLRSTRRGKRQVLFVPRPHAQTTALCAARSLRRVKATDAELDVLAAVLGRGLESRINRTLRREAALTYGGYAQIVRRKRARALFACVRVPSQKTAHALQLFLRSLTNLSKSPPSALELARAKNLLVADIQREHSSVLLSASSVVRELTLGDATPAACLSTQLNLV